MAKKAPNFSGFTLEDIAQANAGLEKENSNAKSSMIEKKKRQQIKTKNSIAKVDTTNTENISSNNKNSIANSSNAKNVNQALFNRVRGYIYDLLGDQKSVEVKFSEIIKNLDINPHSFYKYMRIMKETDFTITKLRYSTEIQKKLKSIK